MGSAFSTPCLGSGAGAGAGADLPFYGADETLGHSFCYLSTSGAGAAAGDHSSRFRSISGASVSANSATPPTVGLVPDLHRPFESTALFGVVPLLPAAAAASGPLDRSAAAGFFLSGPIERGALSGPLDSSSSSSVPFSAPLDPATPRRRRRRGRSLFRSFSVVPIRTFAAAGRKDHRNHRHRPAEFGENVQWAHGKAGEDRVQVVVSDDHRWLFVGIYDGFNGPDAPEFLMGNLYRSVFAELRGLLWVDQSRPSTSSSTLPPHPHRSPQQSAHLSADHGGDSAKRLTFSSSRTASRRGKTLSELLAEEAAEEEDEGIDLSGSKWFAFNINCIHIPTKRRAPSFPSFRFVSSRDGGDRSSLEERLGQSFRKYKAGPVDHDAVLRALARGLAATEAAYLEMTDEFMDRNPELALIGSCLLVVLMRDEDVYVMNVGDSRAIVAQYHPQEMDSSSCDVEGIVETMDCGDQAAVGLAALQLSTDHSTSIEEEVLRIKQEHPDDSRCIVNDRVKGRLKVTRAFGAGFLKQPKWNNGLLEMFRNDYIGTAPYLSCAPSLCHHKLGPNDQFLILSSDGLYQYLTNQEAVSYVESFMERFPDGDPAQHLIEELLLRAAKKAGMDFHQLLDIPQGDRRKYHDDVTVMVISLEGKIWKSSGKYL